MKADLSDLFLFITIVLLLGFFSPGTTWIISAASLYARIACRAFKANSQKYEWTSLRGLSMPRLLALRDFSLWFSAAYRQAAGPRRAGRSPPAPPNPRQTFVLSSPRLAYPRPYAIALAPAEPDPLPPVSCESGTSSFARHGNNAYAVSEAPAGFCSTRTIQSCRTFTVSA